MVSPFGRLIGLCALILVLSTSLTVLGIGIGIFGDETNFEPNLNRNFEAFIINNEPRVVKVELGAEGGLAPYITFSEKIIEVPPAGKAWFSFNLNLPEKINPGRNRLDITAVDSSDVGGGGISAKTAIKKAFFINAPFTGKILDLSVPEPKVLMGKEVIFSIGLSHLGDELIGKISGIIDIYSKSDNNTLVASLSIPYSGSLAPKASLPLTVVWDIKGRKVGDYLAKVKIAYDGETEEEDTGFRIGDLTVKLLDFSTLFIRGGIQKMNVLVQSFWNEPLPGVFTEVFVGEMQLKSASTELAPWGQYLFTAFLDTEALPAGQYPVTIKVHYATKVMEQQGIITFQDKQAQQLPAPS
ncbi:hypothetical protein HYU13_01325, partial [Candidatus Woesearchaeota archaeon]|nr:hypothetical protein [Candidatus Woesearchaeota archaeon]